MSQIDSAPKASRQDLGSDGGPTRREFAWSMLTGAAAQAARERLLTVYGVLLGKALEAFDSERR